MAGVLHNALETKSVGPGRDGKRALCGVKLTDENSAGTYDAVTCQRCLSSHDALERDRADAHRDAQKDAGRPKGAKS